MHLLIAVRRRFIDLGRDRSGVSAVEYALIAALIAAVIIGVVTTLGTNVQTVFSGVGASI